MTLRLPLVALTLLAILCAFIALHARLTPAQVSDHHGYRIRSGAARRAFRRLHPCPATGMVKGACPGYVIDHVKPLACGGADAPGNMQWQTTADAKAKDAVERKDCSAP